MITFFIVSAFATMIGFFLIPLQFLSQGLGGVIPLYMTQALSGFVADFVAFLSYAWPLQPVWYMFLWYASFKLVLTVFRLFFGNHVPDAS